VKRGDLVAAGIAAVASVDFVARARHIAELVPEDARWALPVAGVGIVALAILVWQRRASAGLVALLALSALGWRADFLDGGPRREFYASGVALLGWCMGLGWGKSTRDPDELEVAELGAAAALAATYFSAGMSKLVVGGLEWAGEARTLRAMILTVRAVADGPLTGWDRIGQMVIENPALARLLAIATLVVQLGAPLWLCGRWLRLSWGVMLLGFHMSVQALTGISYREQMALVVLLSLSSLVSLLQSAWARRTNAAGAR